MAAAAAVAVAVAAAAQTFSSQIKHGRPLIAC